MNPYMFISEIVKYSAIIYVAYRLLVEFEMILKPFYKKIVLKIRKTKI